MTNIINKPNTRIFIGKLNNVKMKDLRAICAKYGQIIDYVKKQQYAFIEYENQAQANAALIALHHMKLNGTSITAEMAQPRLCDTEHITSKRLYIGRLKDVNKDEIENMFGPFGKIVDINI